MLKMYKTVQNSSSLILCNNERFNESGITTRINIGVSDLTNTGVFAINSSIVIPQMSFNSFIRRDNKEDKQRICIKIVLTMPIERAKLLQKYLYDLEANIDYDAELLLTLVKLSNISATTIMINGELPLSIMERKHSVTELPSYVYRRVYSKYGLSEINAYILNMLRTGLLPNIYKTYMWIPGRGSSKVEMKVLSLDVDNFLTMIVMILENMKQTVIKNSSSNTESSDSRCLFHKDNIKLFKQKISLLEIEEL